MLDLRHIRQGDPTGHRASAEEYFFKICFLLLPQLVAPSDATINGSCSSYQALHNLCWCYCWASYCWRTLGSINQLCICIGILAALVAGLPLAGNPLWWRTMFGIAIIPSVLLALGMAFSPESPTWLYQQGKFSEAEMAIKRLFEKERVAELYIAGNVVETKGRSLEETERALNPT
ncbi:hypothetical protein RHMOL_Rhmol08G0252900 [Rhododendron molle]|uniref:Uncharacterized protein n=1 Tax=Rhododendron molle TaxID=49168 RepID=A0ACC0MUC5_RHOML|nr:hypothetical protein RHMOL_Rhmol08G0252900 [Rhododendron molle]